MIQNKNSFSNKDKKELLKRSEIIKNILITLIQKGKKILKTKNVCR
jgi:hypothetical protein